MEKEKEEVLIPEKKKSSKGIIVLLIVIIIGLVGYICYDKGVFDGLLGKDKPIAEPEPAQEEIPAPEQPEPTPAPEVEEVKLTEAEIKTLYKSLITPEKSYGLYFDRTVTIDSIDAYNFLPYVVLNYINDKNIDMTKYSPFSLNSELSVANKLKVKKAKMDTYIKNKFNTDRSFVLEKSNYYKGFSDIEFLGNQTKYVAYTYKFSNSSYYIASRADGMSIVKMYSKYLNSSQEGDTLYIYSKMFMLVSYVNGNDITNALSYDKTDENGYEKTKVASVQYGSQYMVGANKANTKRVFKDFDSKLHTFKHTFKKADNGNYYWYSSEIVNK